MVSLIIISGLGGYGLGASLKQFYEGRMEPKWLMVLSTVLATLMTCVGTAAAVYWAITNK